MFQPLIFRGPNVTMEITVFPWRDEHSWAKDGHFPTKRAERVAGGGASANQLVNHLGAISLLFLGIFSGILSNSKFLGV